MNEVVLLSETADDSVRGEGWIVGQTHEVGLNVFEVVVQGIEVQCGSQLIVVELAHVYDARVKGIDFFHRCAEGNI